MKTSYSALDTFQTCPQKYKFQEIDKIKTPKRVEQVFGTVVHGALKYAFERNPLYPTLDEVVNFYTTKWQSASEKIEWKNPERKEAEEKMYFEEGIKILQNFLKKNSPWNFNALELESRFGMELIDEETGEIHTLTGIIDRLDKNPEKDEYEIIDYKTGKKMPSQDMLEDNLQLGLYSLAITKRWPHVLPESIKTSLYFLKHNDKVSATHSMEKLERAKSRILTIIREIERRLESGEFEPTPGPLCGWCGFRPICPMWSHEYKTADEKEAPSEAEVVKAIEEFFAIKEDEEKNKKRIGELRDTVLAYMEQNKVERVFGAPGYITRTMQERTSFDMEKVKEILSPTGKWEEILAPDNKKLDKLFPTLPEKIQKELLGTQEKKIFPVLKQSKKN